MKNYKQILEAINRGIQLALDDFDDEEPVKNIKSKQVQNRDYTKEYLDFQKLISKLENKKLNKLDIEELSRLSKLLNVKYTVNSNENEELRNIVKYICSINNTANLNWLDVSNITNMRNLFLQTDFNGDISEWDISNVRDMTHMFWQCKNFNQPLNNWDVSKVYRMYGVFTSCENFNQPLNNWDVSNVENMQCMFEYCKNFNQPLNNWDVSKVKNMGSMFDFCYNFNQNISNWNIQNVSIRTDMFRNCPILPKYKPTKSRK